MGDGAGAVEVRGCQWNWERWVMMGWAACLQIAAWMKVGIPAADYRSQRPCLVL